MAAIALHRVAASQNADPNCLLWRLAAVLTFDQSDHHLNNTVAVLGDCAEVMACRAIPPDLSGIHSPCLWGLRRQGGGHGRRGTGGEGVSWYGGG